MTILFSRAVPREHLLVVQAPARHNRVAAHDGACPEHDTGAGPAHSSSGDIGRDAPRPNRGAGNVPVQLGRVVYVGLEAIPDQARTPPLPQPRCSVPTFRSQDPG